jgi:signal transduction histidine kinase
MRPVLLGSILVIAAVGMAVAGTMENRAAQARQAAHLDRMVADEIRDFRALSAGGTDPVTGRPFTSSMHLFAAALQLSRPDAGEAMFGVVDGRVRVASAGTTSERLRHDAQLTRTVDRLATIGRPATVDVDTANGPIRLAVEPTGRNDGAAAWVIAYQRGPVEGGTTTVTITYAVVAGATLLLMAVAGWPLARRRPRRGSTSELDFLDDVGHELRTPITVMRGHLELLDGGDWTEVAETRALVLGELDRMSRLVNDLATLTRARRPHFLRLAQIDVGFLMDEVLDKARTLGDRDWRIDARASAFVAADPQRLTQALLALAHNAVKHTAAGDTVALGSRVDVRVGEVRVWVRDTGPGVRPEDQTRIFRRFERGTSNRREGSGLGLAIVTAIAQAHGGRVALESRLGLGATFSLVLPYAGRPTGGHPAPPAHVGPPARPSAPRSTPTHSR